MLSAQMAIVNMGTARNTITQRKADHVAICIDAERYRVENHTGTGFDTVHFVHSALPELSFDQIDTTTNFLNRTISMPLMISCMTGGSAEGYRLNRELALAAQKLGIPVGMGSIRILLENHDLFDHFYLRRYAADVPVIANIGAVQLRDGDPSLLADMLRRLEVDALAVHLNVGQELFQEHGDRDFRGLYEAAARFCDSSALPLIVKETGCGMRPSEVQRLLDNGVAYVDLAGAGGTNWIRVESYRCADNEQAIGHPFDNWGQPTALLLEAVGDCNGRIIASGGLRDGLDMAKSVAMGASIAAMALPFIRAVYSDGSTGAVAFGEHLRAVLKRTMLMTASATIADLRRARLRKPAEFSRQAAELWA